MVDATHVSLRADDRSYFAILKKEIHLKVAEAGFSTVRGGEIDIIVSELTSNLSKYASGGEILFGHVAGPETEYIEVIAIDNGPGMADPRKMLMDGVSTTQTLGHGLGSIRRLSDDFDIFSQIGWGTIVLSRVYRRRPSRPKSTGFELRKLVIAKPGEKVSGDGCYYKVNDDYLKILVADGLGHGPEANRAVNEAVSAFKTCPFNDPVEIIKYLHTGIRKTRGIVATVIIYDFKRKCWSIGGVGNISSKLVNYLALRNYIPYNGIIGHNIASSMKTQEYSQSEFAQIIACSDGLKSRWDTSRLPNIGRHDLSVLNAALYKDFARKTDDMTVISCKVQ